MLRVAGKPTPFPIVVSHATCIDHSSWGRSRFAAVQLISDPMKGHVIQTVARSDRLDHAAPSHVALGTYLLHAEMLVVVGTYDCAIICLYTEAVVSEDIVSFSSFAARQQPPASHSLPFMTA